MRGLPLLIALVGCSPTYAPPIRAAHYGAPGRLGQGQVEFGGSVGGWVSPYVGGPHVGYGVSDHFAVEGGLNLELVSEHDRFALGWLGTRFHFGHPERHGLKLAADAELGIGLGAGGVVNGNDSGTDSLDRVAGGGYGGFGVGFHASWFSLFGRFRTEMSGARGVPFTIWPSAALGLEFRPSAHFALGANGGYLGFWNERDNINGWFYQLQATVILDTPRRRPPPTAPPPIPRPPMPPPPIVEPPPLEPTPTMPPPPELVPEPCDDDCPEE